MNYMVKSLCDVNEIKKTYLSIDRLTSKDFDKWLSRDNVQDESEIMEFKEYLQEYDFPILEVFTFFSNEHKLRVKLVITEICHSDAQKTIRKIISPVISSIPNLNNKFGMFHTAIIVGPWYLEWCDTSLCKSITK